MLAISNLVQSRATLKAVKNHQAERFHDHFQQEPFKLLKKVLVEACEEGVFKREGAYVDIIFEERIH